MMKKAPKRQLQLFTVSAKPNTFNKKPVSVIHNDNLHSDINTHQHLEKLSLKELSIVLRNINLNKLSK